MGPVTDKRAIPFIASVFIFFGWISSCQTGNGSGAAGNGISTDTAVIAKGGMVFSQYCGGCHNFRQGGIGPSLGGVTDSVSVDWIRHFIRDPQKAIGSGDRRAVKLLGIYKSVMPSFDRFTEDELNEVIAFLHVHGSRRRRAAADHGQALSDPIPARIGPPDLEVGLRLLTQFPASTDGSGLPLARITKLDFEPPAGPLFVVDLRGKLYRLQDDKPVVYMDMAGLRPAFIHEPRVATGFGSFAFHPDFAKNGLFYTSHSERAGSGVADFRYADSIKVTLQWVITEWKAKDPGAAAFSGTSRELFRVNMVSGMHGVQEMAFNPLSKRGDAGYGLLYICVGDGACVEEGYPFLAHSRDKVWGTILRIDPAGRNSRNGRYGIPASNPFVRAGGSGRRGVQKDAGMSKDTGVLQEIYAYGFRNPHRITWCRSGRMLACNIGQTNIEAVDEVLPGRDYGWPVREGHFLLDPYEDLDKVYPLPPDDSVNKIAYPVAEYDHDEGKAISGGLEYWGKTVPALKGKFLFGDIPTGRLFYIEMADIKPGRPAIVREWMVSINGKPRTLRELCGSDRVDLHFGGDSRGELYILTKADGKVYQLTDATRIR